LIAPQLGRNGIEYIGPVNDTDKSALLQQSAALLVPIQWDEPFGIVFAEALACGTPVISCARGALPEIIRDGVEGYLIEGVEDGCRAVNGIGNIDRRRCRRTVERLFSADVVVKQYELLYERLLGVSDAAAEHVVPHA
jgi:glycosyltransferase involved in cell wall biosynthesis